MSFQWLEYFTLAHELAGTSTAPSTPEARLRSSISRAYYAAFGMARFHLVNVEGSQSIPASGDAHYAVADAFRTSPDVNRQVIGEALHTLRQYRNQADYDLAIRQLDAKARQALELAFYVIGGIRNL
jgi:uncharacterized protein (UPF0332 family)